MNDANINKVVKGHRAFLSGGTEHPCTYYFHGRKTNKWEEAELLKILPQHLSNLCRV